MKTIFKYAGGSHSYGLQTPESDFDDRFVFLNEDTSKIIGLDRFEHLQDTADAKDSFGYELVNFFKLLRKGNSQCQESLWLDSYLFRDEQFKIIQDNKFQFISSGQLFKCLIGYLNGEKHIITGQNTKQLGAKRKSQIEKYGYSYRNCVHALRLGRAGIIFFRDNYYPVNIVKDDKEYGEFIRDVKINPQNHKVDDLINLIEKFELDLKKCYDSRLADYSFNDRLANELIYQFYMPILAKK